MGGVMPQSKEQRAYWANRRKRDRFNAAQIPKPHPIVLLATSIEEYKKLRAEYPHMKINCSFKLEQEQLFDTKELRNV